MNVNNLLITHHYFPYIPATSTSPVAALVQIVFRLLVCVGAVRDEDDPLFREERVAAGVEGAECGHLGAMHLEVRFKLGHVLLAGVG